VKVFGFPIFELLEFDLWKIRGEFAVQGTTGTSIVEGMSAKGGGERGLEQLR